MVNNIASDSLQDLLARTTSSSGKQLSGNVPDSAGITPTDAQAFQPQQSAQKAEPTPTRPLDSAALKEAISEMTRSAQSLQRSLLFSVDENSGRTVITVVDKATDEIIRQIPPEEVMNMVENFKRNGSLLESIEV